MPLPLDPLPDAPHKVSVVYLSGRVVTGKKRRRRHHDPRLDPRPGDIVCNYWNGEMKLRTVIWVGWTSERFPDRVIRTDFRGVEYLNNGRQKQFVRIARWRRSMWNALVLAF